MLNVHASGSIDMMKAARDAIGSYTVLIAVTLLTSLSSQKLKDELLVASSIDDTVLHYAENAKNAGLKEAIEKVLNLKVINLPIDPQLMGALGAAEFARQKGMAKA